MIPKALQATTFLRLDSGSAFWFCSIMSSQSSLEPAPEQEATEALATILRTTGPGLTREASCYLASVSAAHLIDRLVASGYVVARSCAPEMRLDV
jgi:hypothetical protein